MSSHEPEQDSSPPADFPEPADETRGAPEAAGEVERPVQGQPDELSDDDEAEIQIDRGASPGALAVPGLRTLAVDIGGTGLKVMLLDEAGQPIGERHRVPTPRPATPEAILDALYGLLPHETFDRVSVGFPGVVVEGVIHTAPNLDPSWAGYDLQRALTERTRKPTRVLNDAGVQGFGVIEGRGVEMLISLGTGMGCAIYLNGKYLPNIELAHHPFRKGRTYEEYISNEALKHIGKKKWNRRVRRVIDQILVVFNPRVLYIGGGNARKLAIELPAPVKVVDNVAGLLGGAALWG